MPDRAFFEREVQRQQPVVLEFNPGIPWTELHPIGLTLARLLPDYSVFQSAANSLTVMHLLPEAQILPLAAELAAAAACFRQIAARLVGALERHLGVSRQGLLDPGLKLSERGSGEVDGWEYWLHGRQCLFVHLATGQHVDVHLHGADVGVLDPFFFHQFLASTPEFAQLAAALPDAYHDTRRAIEILVRHGIIVLPRGEAGSGGTG